MSNFLNKLERKYGKYSVKYLMKYIIGIYLLGAFIGMANPNFYYQYLFLDVSKVLSGQVWRVFTFVLEPMGGPAGGSTSFFFFLISMYFYWIIGMNLEISWGTFRFNLYYLSGMLLNVIAAFITYAVTKDPFTGLYFGLNYINESLLLAYCAMYPNMTVLLMFVLPIKVKYLGMFYGGMIALQIIQLAAKGNYIFAVAIIVALLNFILFFFSAKNDRRAGFYRQRTRREPDFFERNEKKAEAARKVARHKCAICGRTEMDDPTLEFRFCSRCEGDFEYCNEHLFTHQHVKK